MLNLSHKVIKGLSNSQIAKNETNDCFVRALAAATGQDYDTAHKVASIDFNRDHKKGVSITDLGYYGKSSRNRPRGWKYSIWYKETKRYENKELL